MKTTEYAGSYIPGAEEKQQMLDSNKYDDYSLPEFTKEVPTSSNKKEHGDTISIDYKWKEHDTPSILVKHIDFRKGENLGELYRIAARDGADSLCFTHKDTTYILRKTAREIAQALYNAYGKIRGAVENIVGYLRTVLGNDYVISAVKGEAWTFDKRIARNSINYVDADSLGTENKSRLIEMITEKISELHTNNLIMGRFTLNNILLGESDMVFTDLRKLRVSRRKTFVIDEFVSMLQYLFAVGMATRDDIYYSVAYYTSQNEESCKKWHSENKGKKNAEQAEIVATIEDMVFH